MTGSGGRMAINRWCTAGHKKSRFGPKTGFP